MKYILGGFIGYWAGRSILPWKYPPSKSVSVTPLSVKCHSNKEEGVGLACIYNEGSFWNWRISACILLTYNAWLAINGKLQEMN